VVWVGSITGAACSDDATDEGSVYVVSVIGATMEGPGTCSSGVGCPVNSLNEAPRLLETGVSTDELSGGVKPIWRGVNCGLVLAKQTTGLPALYVMETMALAVPDSKAH